MTANKTEEKNQLIAEIIANLRDLPTKILKNSTDLYVQKKQYSELIIIMQSIVASHTKSINDDISPEGKIVYSNDTKRQTELRIRLNEDKTYQNYMVSQKNIKNEVDDLVIKAEFYNNTLKSAVALSRLIGDA